MTIAAVGHEVARGVLRSLVAGIDGVRAEAAHLPKASFNLTSLAEAGDFTAYAAAQRLRQSGLQAREGVDLVHALGLVPASARSQAQLGKLDTVLDSIHRDRPGAHRADLDDLAPALGELRAGASNALAQLDLPIAPGAREAARQAPPTADDVIAAAWRFAAG